MRLRWRAVTALTAVAAGVALTAGACGVQPTGVNVASTTPFDVSRSSSGSPSASSVGGSVAVTIFLVPKYGGVVQPVTRWVSQKPTAPTDLLPLLWDVNATDSANNLGTSVPPDIKLVPTDKAHEFLVVGPTRPGSIAMKQMACTFDAYWRQHVDTHDPSTQFIFPDVREGGSGWDDCPQYFGEGNAAVPATGKPTKPAQPSATPGFLGY